MKFCAPVLTTFVALALSSVAEPAFKCNFNVYKDGPIDGQFDWDVYEKTADSSGLSIINELGCSEVNGDRALVLKESSVPIRCVMGEPVRWLPGHTLTMEFDFKVAAPPTSVFHTKPVMTIFVGNSLLSAKSRFAVRLEALPKGDWQLSGEMPDEATKKLYGENFLIRSKNDVSISEWYRFSIVINKLSEPDSFETTVEVRDPETGKVVTSLRFEDYKKDKVAKSMWDTIRAHVGFSVSREQYGVVCVDNLEVSVSE